MKALAFVLVLAASTLSVGETRIVLDTTGIGPHDARVMSFDGGNVVVTITRDGEVRHLRVERRGLPGDYAVNDFVIEPAGGRLQARVAGGSGGSFAVTPRRIVVDGVALDAMLPDVPPRAPAGPRYYICPADETMVRVKAPHAGDLRCPLDGVKMRKAQGHSSSIFLLE